ncbi:MAG: glycerol-3-phosphate dehydrogenase [Gammaproteobacteria bacterium]|nr:glycerol-3-phosphate dehydrogenase [Gammaproteobacteria bacterium]MDD9959565.1 glycerol-3-phosphate dehydrogenase [Gammaproteobacteria bacterium]
MNKSNSVQDILVIGGGINGAGIAADAASRGLSVVLCEKGDLASATSSNSSKLIHGGLRYLEFYEFGLVRKSLKEREILASIAPHIVRPLAFQIPQLSHSRRSWLLKAGLFLYDNLAKRDRFKNSSTVRYSSGSLLNDSIKHGFEYWDAQVDDARLVILNALQARSHGASIYTRVECVALNPVEQGWSATFQNHLTNESSTQVFRAVVNATGPWVSSLLENLTEQGNPHPLRMVKGSHIVVPRIHGGDEAYLLQHHDGRIVFVIPYLSNYSLIGTTEEEYRGDLDKVEISNDEIDYLISIVNLYFRKAVHRSDIIHTYSGVRPLIDQSGKSASSVSRDYRLELETHPFPLLSVYGGKVTTYRVLAEQAVSSLVRYFPRMPTSNTSKTPLPGGDFGLSENLFQDLATKYGWLDPDLLNRWLASYGRLSFDILGNVRGLGDLGVKFGANLYQLEVDYLCKEEWARTAEDILWRRTKLGYVFNENEKQSLENYIKQSNPH